jgi:hypothetical protein
LSNSILQGEGLQCLNSGTLDELTSSNLFEQGRGCGEPILRADPKLGKLDYFNGPTPTLPLSSLSPALNLGNNSVAVNHNGEPLKWDQRGNGDPRFARGYVDIGAFEHQSQLPRELIVDTTGDTVLRGCTPIAPGNCPLKAAVDLSLSGRTLVPIRFKQSVFTEDQTLQIDVLPENADQPLVIDGSGTGGVTIMVPASVPWRAINGARIELTASTSRNGR